MITFNDRVVQQRKDIDVRFFFEHTTEKFKVELYTDESGFERRITEANVHRPGLALAGFVELFSYSRVQLFGNTEMRYLRQLSEENRIKSIKRLFEFDLPCIIISNGQRPEQQIIDLANEFHIPIFGTPFSTTKTVYLIGDFLDDQFASKLSIHGSFVDVYGVGIMFVGKSGVGKSEVALDLIERGHRMVADDVVILTKKGEGILMGAGTELAKHFMEVRGLGLINITKMFGIRSIRYQKRLEVVVELEIWQDDQEYDRTGLDDTKVKILDTEILYVKLPIVPGKNITVISEVIALNYLLKHYGYDGAKVFQNRLNKVLSGDIKYQYERGIDYFEHDFE